MEKNTNLNKAGVETNLLYMMSLAMDLIMRDTVWRMAKEKERFKHEKKQIFTRYAKTVRDACVLQEMLTQDIYDCDAKHNYKNVQLWQEESNELARLNLLFADRSANQDIVDGIFKYVREQPGEGIVDEELLKAFYLK